MSGDGTTHKNIQYSSRHAVTIPPVEEGEWGAEEGSCEVQRAQPSRTVEDPARGSEGLRTHQQHYRSPTNDPLRQE